MRTRILAILAGLAAAALLAWLLGGHHQSAPPPPTNPPAAGPSAPGASSPAITGNYADDWQRHCAPLTGPAQADCTRRLDQAYGKSDATPVPPPAVPPAK